MNTNPTQRPASISLATAFWYWLKLGFISFGGPAGQIALMHTDLVERRRWISEQRFLHALNYCMVLPGPEALSSVVEGSVLSMVGTLTGAGSVATWVVVVWLRPNIWSRST